MTLKIKYSMVLSKKSILYVLLYIFVLSCILFPADFHHIKKLSFVALMLLGLDRIVACIGYYRYRIVFFIGIVFPVGTILHSILLGSNISNAVLDGYTGIFFLLMILICEFDIDYENILKKSLKILCYITLLLVILDLLGIADVNSSNAIRNFIYDNNIGFIGKSSEYAAYYKVFIKTSPLLIVLLYDSFEKKRWIDVAASFLALNLSGTRANIFVSFGLLFAMIFLVETNTDKQKRIKFFAIVVTLFLGILFTPRVIKYASNMMFTAGSIASDAVRSGQIKGLIEALRSPFELIFGAGYGNVLIYDYGRGVESIEFEWAYFSLLRKVGLIWFTAYMVFLVKPLFKRIKLSTKVLHIGYMAITFTNPLLYSSTAMILFLYTYILIDEIYNKPSMPMIEKGTN